MNAALTGGGSVTFSCSGAITITATKIISTDTAINGGGRTVTIDGGGAVRLFIVNSGANFGVNSLTLANGHANGSGGAILNTYSRALPASQDR